MTTPRYGYDYRHADATIPTWWTETTCTGCHGTRRQPYGPWTVTCGRCMGWGVIRVRPEGTA